MKAHPNVGRGSRQPSRRTLLAAALALGATTLLPVSPQALGEELRFRAVRVDASPLAAQGSPGYARRVEALVTPRVEAVFADRLGGGRGAPILVLRIDSLSLSGFAGFSRRRGGGNFNDQNDYLEGEGVVVGAGGNVLSRVPILSALSPSYSGSAYIENIDDRRVSNIGWHFASWVKRKLSL